MTRKLLATTTAPVLIYDGDCGFCSRSVQFILRHENRHDLLFAPRQSELGMKLRREAGLEGVESMLWVHNGRVYTESSAVLGAANYTGGVWSLLAKIGALIPSGIRNWIYRLIAKNRQRMSRESVSCFVPTQEQRKRFLN